jgi:hypothetical protein
MQPLLIIGLVVFRDPGYEIANRYNAGIIVARFDILGTHQCQHHVIRNDVQREDCAIAAFLEKSREDLVMQCACYTQRPEEGICCVEGKKMQCPHRFVQCPHDDS